MSRDDGIYEFPTEIEGYNDEYGMPTETKIKTAKEFYVSFGFEVKDVDEEITVVKLPDGWEKHHDEGNWSKVIDNNGTERMSIYHKPWMYADAAFFLRLENRFYHTGDYPKKSCIEKDLDYLRNKNCHQEVVHDNFTNKPIFKTAYPIPDRNLTIAEYLFISECIDKEVEYWINKNLPQYKDERAYWNDLNNLDIPYTEGCLDRDHYKIRLSKDRYLLPKEIRWSVLQHRGDGKEDYRLLGFTNIRKLKNGNFSGTIPKGWTCEKPDGTYPMKYKFFDEYKRFRLEVMVDPLCSCAHVIERLDVVWNEREENKDGEKLHYFKQVVVDTGTQDILFESEEYSPELYDKEYERIKNANNNYNKIRTLKGKDGKEKHFVRSIDGHWRQLDLQNTFYPELDYYDSQRSLDGLHNWRASIYNSGETWLREHGVDLHDYTRFW